MKSLLLLLLWWGCIKANAQRLYSGVVKDAASGEVLSNASIRYYKEKKQFGLITNREGRFDINGSGVDSITFTMIGYGSKTFYAPFSTSLDVVHLTNSPSVLDAVVIHSLSATDIVKKAAARISAYQPKTEFESEVFYREIIRDKKAWFSVSEALFQLQFFPKTRDYKLKLATGRSKEDVSYTRLFEDFHPGGGPQRAVEQSFLINVPDCLAPGKMSMFSYHKDSVINDNGKTLYVIGFDQNPGVKEALEKGQVFIAAEDFSVVRYEAVSSPAGSAYIKSLKGTDKLMAEILKVEFKIKAWARRLHFTNLNGQWLLSFAALEHQLSFKQPKKGTDLDLSIESELLFTELHNPLNGAITPDDEWKRKNLVINLPVAFDSSFWGGHAVITPTEELKTIVASIARNNGEPVAPVSSLSDWSAVNRHAFVGYHQADTIVLIPLMKSSWEDESTAGLLYREVTDDFVAQCRINLTKNSSPTEAPDKGFQQAGIMIRNSSGKDEAYVLASIGTGGNQTPKIFFKKTSNSNSKTVVEKLDKLEATLKLEKKGDLVTSYAQIDGKENWVKLGSAKMDTKADRLQVGVACFADFAGDGPKMRPDMKVVITNWKVTKL
jgi:hypothetical protein